MSSDFNVKCSVVCRMIPVCKTANHTIAFNFSLSMAKGLIYGVLNEDKIYFPALIGIRGYALGQLPVNICPHRISDLWTIANLKITLRESITNESRE